MTFAASLLDLRTGQMIVANASHFPPYIYSPGPQTEENPLQAIQPVHVDSVPALGRQEELTVKTASVQLKPGDMIFWYTDGFFEGPEAVGKKVSNRKLLKLLVDAGTQHAQELPKACEAAMAGLLEIMGPVTDKPDDITLIFAKIPDTAKFEAVSSSTAEETARAA